MYCVKATQVDIELTLFTEGKGKKTQKNEKVPKRRSNVGWRSCGTHGSPSVRQSLYTLWCKTCLARKYQGLLRDKEIHEVK